LTFPIVAADDTRHAVRTLLAHGAAVPFFRGRDEREIAALLCPAEYPRGSISADADAAFRAEVQAGMGRLDGLREELQDFLGLLVEWPHTALPAVVGDSPARPPDRILSHGERQYSIGDHDPILLTEPEDTVLQAYLLERPPGSKPPEAMDKPTLCDHSGLDHAPRVLRNLRQKYDGRFAPAIQTPEGRKAAGGYRVRIRRAESPVTQHPPSIT